MASFHPATIPWKSKAEWLDTFENAYSGDYVRAKIAMEVMEDWSKHRNHFYRPGIDATQRLLNIALKDKEIFPDAENPFNCNELQLLYSAEIMRFLNVAGCSYKGGAEKKTSLYTKAKEMGIEDWIVNIRHSAAHSDTLPSLSVLRMAYASIMSLLKSGYWEIEKEEMIVINLEDPDTVFSKNMAYLLRSYVSLKEQSILGFKKVKDIQDPDVKHLLSCINTYSLSQLKAQCKPYDLKSSENLKINMDHFNNLLILKAIFSVLKLLKEYIDAEQICQINPLNVLIDYLIEDSVEHNGMRTDVWNSILRALHSWYKFPDMLRILCRKSFEMKGESAYQAGMWCTQLCKALQKRFQVELLCDQTIKNLSLGNAIGRKKIDLSPTELKKLKQLCMKKYSKEMSVDSRMFAWMFVRVEERRRELREVIRLKYPIFPEQWELMDLLGELSVSPGDFTPEAFQALKEMLEWPLAQEQVEKLGGLRSIYLGSERGVAPTRKRRIFTPFHLHEAIKAPNKYWIEYPGRIVTDSGLKMDWTETSAENSTEIDGNSVSLSL